MGWLAVAAIVAIALYPIFSNSGGKAVRKRLITGMFLSVLLVPNAYARDNSNASAAKPWVCDPTRPEGGKQVKLGDALGGLLGAPTSNGRPVRREEPEMLTPEEQEARFACGRERLRLAQETYGPPRLQGEF